MLNSLFSTLSKAVGLNTYKIGLLQTKAYRILNQETARILKPYHITPIDWALLGLLYENPDGLRLSHIAEELGVEAPFITEQSQDLIKLKLITIEPTLEDKRVKMMRLTDQANQQIPEIEKALIRAMLPILEGSTITDLKAYKKTLSNIVKNKPSK
jgi:DNA-binding MarR family transcriptional regulator